MTQRPLAATADVLSRYVTVADVAEALGCSDDHVRGMLSDGLLPYIDISRRGKSTRRPKIRVPIAAVERYLEKQVRRAPAKTVAAPRITRDEAIANAARTFVEACRVRDSLPVEEAARQAYTPTGPSIPELERIIRARRGLIEEAEESSR